MCYWKQWRYVRTKVRNLLKLGTYKREAIFTALSRKGPWHSARTLATQAGMTNKWLTEQGLISVKEQWVKIHYPATRLCFGWEGVFSPPLFYFLAGFVFCH